MIWFLGSILSIAMLELSIELSSSLLIEGLTHCTNFLSKVYVEQHLEAVVYVVTRFVLTISYDRNYSEHVLGTHSPLIITASIWSWYFAAVSVLNMYILCPWFEWFGCLCFVYYAWSRFHGGESWQNKLHAYSCSYAIQHITWYMHTLYIA